MKASGSSFNGEIYNFQEIRATLEKSGHQFSSDTDTEVIIHAYEEWGTSCVERFNGMWAFAIYDKNKGILFFSRDRFGIKPLYFCRNEKGLVFSSEIKGILQHPLDALPTRKQSMISWLRLCGSLAADFLSGY